MTTTIVYAVAGDGYINSGGATYAIAQAGTGPMSVYPSANAGYFGQNNNGGSYSALQAFFRFSYAAVPATEAVTSAAIQVRVAAMLSASVTRDLEVRGAPWSGGGLTVADWHTPAMLTATGLYATFAGINAAPVGSRTRAGSEALRSFVAASTGAEFVLCSSRQRAGISPTVDEGAAVYLSGASGTVNDPALVFTTVTRSRLFGVVGAQAQLSDETWAYLENTGSAIEVKHVGATGTVTSFDTLPIGTTAGTFAAAAGAQALALVADASDNLYVAGRFGAGAGQVAIRPYAKGTGYTWAALTMRTAALPAHTAEINQVAAAFTDPGVPQVAVLAARTVGTVTAAGAADVAYATFSTATLLGGAGSVPLSVGDAASIAEPGVAAGDFGGHRNEVGSGLDLASGTINPGWLYAATFHRGQVPGDNTSQLLGRLVVDATGTVTDQSRSTESGYGTKDASAKLRTMAATSNLGVIATADRDSGYGISVAVHQHMTPPSATVGLAGVELSSESIPSMPDGPAVGTSLAWDAGYSAVENRVWVYYVDATNARVVRRTPVSLDSYTATRQEVTVYTAPAGATIQALRLPRGAKIGSRTCLQVAYAVAGVNSLANVVDQYNAPPTAPIQSPRGGFDAATSATLLWTFTDPNPTDSQSAYQIQIEDTAAPGVSVLDTGKLANDQNFHILAAGALLNGKTYQWRVRTWDLLDAAGVYSGWSAFTTASGGTVTITNPATDNLASVNTDEVQVGWSVAGAVQAGYRVWLYRGATLVSDTGWITSTAQTHLVTGLTSDTQHEIRVQVRNSALTTSNVGTRLVTPSYGAPETPAVQVTARHDLGYVEVVVSNPAPGQPASTNPEFAFEPGMSLTGWFWNGAFTLDTAQAYRGVGSGKLVAAGTAETYVRPPLVPVTPVDRMATRFWAWSATARSIRATIDWWSDPATLLSNTSTVINLPAGVWTLCRHTASPVEGATYATHGPTIPAPTVAGDTVFIDDLLLAPASDRPEVYVNEIYRRTAGAQAWDLIGTCDPDTTYRDYAATGSVPYEYKARGIG